MASSTSGRSRVTRRTRKRPHATRVIRNHRRAAYGVPRDADDEAGHEHGATTKGSRSTPVPIDAEASSNRPAATRPSARLPTATKCSKAAREECLGPGLGTGRGARLPQRTGDGHRAHRHDRSANGLRHHRRRARLRPGQVQEARGRRLLQDRQPITASGARKRSGYDADQVKRHPEPMSWAHSASTWRCPDADRGGIAQGLAARQRASTRMRTWRRWPMRCRRCLNCRFAFNALDAWRRLHGADLELTRGGPKDPGFNLLKVAWACRANRRSRSSERGRSAARRPIEGAPYLQGRAPAGVRLCEHVRADWRAVHPRPTATSA